MIEERTTADTVQARYLHGAMLDEILVRSTFFGNTYYHHDQIGSTTALTDASGALVEQTTYDAYGTPAFLDGSGITVSASPTGNAYLYTGREWLPIPRLADHRNRYYQPDIGRWLTSDPIEENGGLNLYEYVANDPIDWRDSFGLDATSWGGDGRGTSDGPKNGNWGGKNWSGGWNPSKHGGQSGPGQPTDSADECYRDHDNCYGACDQSGLSVPNAHSWRIAFLAKCKKPCDAKLVECLKKLNKDCKKWPRPPRKGTENDSEDFRDKAISFFK